MRDNKLECLKIAMSLYCSFCGKDQNQVRLVAGPTAFICNECVELCRLLLTKDGSSVQGKGKAKGKARWQHERI